MPSISLSMIVKNEESMLPRCLDSVKGWVDEIIVVDTGSTDKTIEIAERYGAFIYHHPWENDFSKHRNQSLGYATGDWILIIDADEKIENGHGDRIKKLVADCPEDITKIYFIVKDIQKNQTAMVFQSIRLFRNNIGIHYQGIIHNKIIAPSGKSIKSDIVLYHYGYGLCEEDMDRKFHRTYSLLQNQLEEDPNDLFALYNMATELQNRSPQKSIDYGVRLLSLLKQKNNVPVFYVNIFYVLAAAYVQLKAIDKAIDICLEAMHIFPKYLDAYWILCECYFDKKDYSRVIDYGNRFVQQLTDYESHMDELSELFVYSYNQRDKVALRLGISYLFTDKWIQAEPYLRDYIKAQESRFDAVDTILGHLKAHHPDYVRIKEKVGTLIHADASKSVPPTISLCMIVKNEEKDLPRCLDSVKGWVDEIIIVDTGSTDNTVVIAKRYGAKVYFHPWDEDFSKHRNQSISYATGDWILWMDADEVVEPGGGERIRKTMDETDADAILVTVVSYFDQQTKEAWNNSKKLFRNHAGIHFEGIIHNQVRGNKVNAFCLSKIYHYGYDLTLEQKRKKFDRTSTLLKKRIKEEPHVFRHHHDLAVCYQSMGKYKDALCVAERAISISARQNHQEPDVVLWSYFVAASCSFNLQQTEKAESYALESLDVYRDQLDPYFILSMIHHRRNDPEKFDGSFQNYLQTLDRVKSYSYPNTFIVHNTIGDAWRLHLARADLYLREGDRKEAETQLAAALAVCPVKSDCWRLMGSYYRKNALWGKARDCFENARTEGLPEDKYLYDTALVHKEQGRKDAYRDTLEIIETMGSQDPEILLALGNATLAEKNYEKADKLFKQALEVGVEDPIVYTNWAVACKGLGKIDEAIEYNLKAIAIKSDMPEALINLGHLYFDLKRYDEAQSCFLKALHLQPDAIDVYLRLGLISLFRGNVENCIEIATLVLRILGKNVQLTLDGMEDLASVYRMISHDFKVQGSSIISRDAARIASILNQGAVTAETGME